MGLIRVIFELFALYLLYKLIFDFIIPVYKTTKQVSRKMGDMQNKMSDHLQQQSNAQTGTSTEKASKPGKSDYIEFEEVR